MSWSNRYFAAKSFEKEFRFPVAATEDAKKKHRSFFPEEVVALAYLLISFWTFSSSSNKNWYAERWFKNRFHNYSTTDCSFQNTWIVNRSGYYANVWRKSYKKSEIPYSWSTSSNIILVKKKARGLLIYKFKNTQQLFSLFHSVIKHNVCSWGKRGKRLLLRKRLSLSRKTIFSAR